MSYIIPEGLLDDIRGKADELRELGALQAAKAWEGAADVVREAARKHATEPISSKLAAKESGYTRRHLLRLVRDGDIARVGQRGRMLLVRRMDIPRKPGGAGISTPGPTLEATGDTLVSLAG